MLNLKDARCIAPGDKQHGTLVPLGEPQTLVSLSGPMNISYSRRLSAPYMVTTSSGLTTFPRLLLILCARDDTLTLGCSRSTYPLPFFSTSASSILQQPAC